MTITPSLFDAFLKCPTKCWLRAHSETPSGNTYAEWVQSQNESFRAAQTERLLAETPPDASARSPSLEKLKASPWRLAVNVVTRTPELPRSSRREEAHSSVPQPSTPSSQPIDQSLVTSAATSAQSAICNPHSVILESHLHAVERVPAEGRGKAAQFVPIRFISFNKLGKDDKLLLGFDAFVLSAALGRDIAAGKIIHGDDHATLKVKTSALAGEVRKRLEKMTALLSNPTSPDLVLNRHCGECEFQARCRKIALEKDDLSLLGGMSAKERQKLRSKGIFTVTQLSYTFRPRRRPKRLRDKREKYHHSLKALAIREKKIHIVGSPELKIEGTPVYLDVEGLPDRDFYYLIGLRIGNGNSAVQHSLWADTVEDEGKIWREFLAMLETVEKPVLIHYGSYETTFIKRMGEQHGFPCVGSVAAAAMHSAMNLVSFLFAQIYFPTVSNGLKEVAGWLGFRWSEREPSGVKAILWRHGWEQSRSEELKDKLKAYNAEDCHAVQWVCSMIFGGELLLPAEESCGGSEREVVRAETLKDERLQKWREFKSPLPEFEALTRAAHWHYQRSRVIVSQHRKQRKVRIPCGRTLHNPRIYKAILSRASRICPGCHKRKRGTCRTKTRYRYELFTGRSSLKVRLVKYVFETYFCRRCNLTFGDDPTFGDLHRFGWSLVSFLIYQVIGLNVPQRKVAESFTRFFGIPLSTGSLHELKGHVADYYRGTWQQILDRIKRGNLVHVDETKINLHHSSGYVWVLTNLNEVGYVYSPSREAELPKDLLSDFDGVLVSDFYAAYDAIACRHQRCLIHLIRDLNDEVLTHPYNEELKAIVLSFGGLLKPIVETIDRRGLKSHFLRKFRVPTDRFFKQLARLSLTTEPAQKCRQRFEKNRNQLFTFLEHDGIPWNNNNAEHAIKAVARLRSNVTGLTTEKGLEDYLVLLSVSQTCDYMGVDFLYFLRSGEKDIHAFAESRRRRRRRSPANEPKASPADSSVEK